MPGDNPVKTYIKLVGFKANKYIYMFQNSKLITIFCNFIILGVPMTILPLRIQSNKSIFNYAYTFIEFAPE